MLFLEFHSTDAAVKEQSEEAGRRAAEFNGMGFVSRQACNQALTATTWFSGGTAD